MNQLIQKNKNQLDTICKKHFVKKLYLFGSAVTDSFTEDSDFDFFYEINSVKDDPGFDYASNIFSLENEFARIFGRKIDLIKLDFSNPQLFINAVADKKVLLYGE